MQKFRDYSDNIRNIFGSQIAFIEAGMLKIVTLVGKLTFPKVVESITTTEKGKRAH